MAIPKRKATQQDIFRPEDEAADVIPMPVSENANAQRRPERIGAMLKRERERRGYDLQQISDYLCIRRGLLVALEESRYDAFPADAYAIGFLRSYAELLGVNGQEAIDHYRREMTGRRKKPDLVLPTPVGEGRAPTAVIIGVAVVASLLIYVLWYALSSSDRAAISRPPPLPTTVENTATPVPAPDAKAAATQDNVVATAPSGIAIAAPAPSPLQTPVSSTPVPSQAAPAATTAPVEHLTIKADQSSWVLVANAKGQTIYDHVMKPGDIYSVPNTPGLTLTTGNGAGILLTLDGTPLPRLSATTSHIMRNVPLDNAALKALPEQPGQ